MPSEANLNIEAEHVAENEVDSMELALSEVDKVNRNKVEPLNKADLEKIAENYEDIEFKELRQKSIELIKLLGKEKDATPERRKELIDKVLGKEVPQKETQEVETSDKRDFGKALKQVLEVKKDPNIQLTNAKLQEIASDNNLDFGELKKRVREMADENFEKQEQEGVNKEEMLAEIKSMYLNKPNELTTEAITKRGFTTQEIRDMIPKWKEEKKRDILED